MTIMPSPFGVPLCWTCGLPAHIGPCEPTYQPLNPNIHIGPLPRILTEADVQRIVREEISRTPASPASKED